MAIAYINGSKTDPTGSGATTVASPALSTTSGRLIIVAAYGLRVDYTGLSITAVTDTAGNTYTEAASYTDGGVRQSIYYAYNITGNASNVVTVTFSQECLYRICAQHEYSGALTTDPLDSARNGTVGYGTDLWTGETDSYYANDMMFAFYTMNTTPTFTAGDGFTNRLNVLIGQTEDDVDLGAAGSYGSTMTTSTSGNWCGVHAMFRQAVSSPTFPFRRRVNVLLRLCISMFNLIWRCFK